MKFRK